MGDKKKKRRSPGRKCRRKLNKGLFRFAAGPGDVVAHMATLLEQHRLRDVDDPELLGMMPDPMSRRVLRGALRSRDSTKIKKLVTDGVNINMVIDEVFWDTPLTFAVKCGYLEIVEILVDSPGCAVDQHDRNKHTALDEAIKTWLLGANVSSASCTKQDIGRRYRILRCLLAAGASDVTVKFLDNLVFSRLNTKHGLVLICKLVKACIDKGSFDIKSKLLSVLIPYKHTTDHVSSLVQHGADPMYYLRTNPVHPTMPLDNAIIILKATNHRSIHIRIDGATSGNRELMENQWTKYREIVRLLTLSGYQVQLSVMMFLYQAHATVYRWCTMYRTRPPSLKDLCRVAVRTHLQPNVMAALTKLRSLPDSLKPFLLFED